MTRTSHSLAREKKTIVQMIKMYCRSHHNTTSSRLCQNCEQLLQYALQRLDKCPFAPDKGPCSQCKTRCYEPSMRKLIREVMRYAGPRMLFTHPVLAINHLLKKYKPNVKSRKTESNN
ncbi:MAG: nitrous oxide-stimulated promoter family protein [Planctomycetota bacterium]